MKNFYITTPIYYPNAKPHIGTAYTTIVCDVVARYKKLKGYNVRYATGIDEHGQKIQESALKNNVSPQEWVDRMKEDFVNLWNVLDIDYDKFTRTTSKEHKYTVKDIVKKVYENGDIYAGEYIGKYSVSEETFVTESQLVDGKYMGKEVIDMKEKSYFFKLSKYQDKLLEFYENNPDFIKPLNKKNEVLSFINQGLQDLSISRTTFDWGIPLELEEGHVIYVWFDALNSYLTSAGYSNLEEFDKYWNNAEVVHMVGKDILRFHAIIWPAMLMSAGIKLPTTLAVHGWWTRDGEKMSKSLGNVVDPIDEVKKYGLDQFRYFLLREPTFGQDADYSNSAMIQRINSDLANDLGNLLNRVMGMQKKYFESVVENKNITLEIDEEINNLWKEILIEVDDYYNQYNFSEMLRSIWKYISRLNKYIDENEPWNLYKNNELDRLNTVLYYLVDGIYKVAVLLSPVIPRSSNEILNQLGIDKKCEEINIDNLENYPTLNKLNESKVLFPRIEIEKSEFEENLKIENPINIEDFNKINIRVVEIKKVEILEDNKALLKIIVDTGKEKRQIISGIAKYYKNEKELVGKKVIAVLNLEPIEIRGYLSQGMLLTASEKKKVTLIFVNDDVKLSTVIK